MYGAYAGERLPEQENDFRGVLYKSVVDPEDPEHSGRSRAAERTQRNGPTTPPWRTE